MGREHLPFKLNLGEVPLQKEHQAIFIDFIYSNQEFFSLHDEDLSHCDWLTHTVLTITSKPVFLSHRMVPQQMQGKVYTCLNVAVSRDCYHIA